MSDAHGWRYARRQGDLFRLVGGSLVLAVSAAIAAEGTQGWEISVFRAVNDLPESVFWPVWVVMQLGALAAVPIAALAALLFRHVRLAVNLAISGTLAYLAALLVKNIVGRPRPSGVLSGVHLRHMTSGGLGFPSGHAAVATALAVSVFPYLGRRGRAAIWVLAVIVSFARMYVGAHFPLDVIGGAALGTAVGSAVHRVLGAPIERGSHRWVLSKQT
jgi:PAP2 superfamily.